MLEYYLRGDNPQILFLSGMHGDEYESGAILEEFIKKQREYLPEFLYIPRVSPSAVASGSRLNAYGNDINRQFDSVTQDKEALNVMRLLSKYSFDLVLDIHEDPEQKDAFYLYDSGGMSASELETYKTCVQSTTCDLFTGIDDPGDTTLGCTIEEGYYSFRPNWKHDGSVDEGFSSKWMIRNGIAKRVFTLEIPGKAKALLKQSLVEQVVPFLMSTFGI